MLISPLPFVGGPFVTVLARRLGEDLGLIDGGGVTDVCDEEPSGLRLVVVVEVPASPPFSSFNSVWLVFEVGPTYFDRRRRRSRNSGIFFAE